MTSLYRIYSQPRNDHKLLLYVGITNNLQRRLKQHRINQAWWHLVDSVVYEEFPDEWDARIAEYTAIGEEWPIFNRADHPDPTWARAIAIEPRLIDVVADAWSSGDLANVKGLDHLVGWRRVGTGPDWLFSASTYDSISRVLDAMAA